MIRIFLLYAFLFIIIIAQAQVTEENNGTEDKFVGMEAGLNVGVYFGNKNTANFYNGAGNEDGMNSADKIIYNVDYRNMINEVLEQNGFRYLLGDTSTYHAEYPTNMTYLPAIYAGLTGRYWLSKSIGISVSMNYSKLVTKDNFVIYNDIEMPPSNKEDQYILSSIMGEEDRINIDIGMINKFALSDKINFIIETGFNLNNTVVRMNKIEIYGLVLDIKYKGPYDYIPGGNTPQYEFRQGGIGYGAYTTPGLQFNFNDNISVDLVSQFYYTYIELEHYSNWGFQWAPYIRFNFTHLFF